jgi:hypothetical protein
VIASPIVELRHLAALHAIADTENFREAARQLGYSQSAISQQLAKLEQVTKIRLVERAPAAPETSTPAVTQTCRPRSNASQTPPLGTTSRTEPAHPHPRPPRLSEHPRHQLPASRRTETRDRRPWTPTRLTKPTASTPLRRRQNRQTRPEHHRPQAARRLKNKLKSLLKNWFRRGVVWSYQESVRMSPAFNGRGFLALARSW